MNWFTYDFFDPLLPSEKWKGKNAAPVPQYVQELVGDLGGYIKNIRCNDWSAEEYIGGIKTFKSRVCIFRMFNGGRDRVGRPHRWILLIAENDLVEWKSLDVLEVLEFPIFKQYAAIPVVSPVPFPSIYIECLPSLRTNINTLPDSLKIDGNNAEIQIRDTSVRMTSGKEADGLLIVEKHGNHTQAWFKKSVLPIRQPTPKLSEIKPPTPKYSAPRFSNSELPYSNSSEIFVIMKRIALVLIIIISFISGFLLRGYMPKKSKDNQTSKNNPKEAVVTLSDEVDTDNSKQERSPKNSKTINGHPNASPSNKESLNGK